VSFAIACQKFNFVDQYLPKKDRFSWPCSSWSRCRPRGIHLGCVSKRIINWYQDRENLRQSDFESLLDGLEHLLVLLAADEGDTETLGTETTSTTDTMKVGVGIARKIVVDGEVDTLNIDTTTEDVSGDTDTLVELLELLVALDTGWMSDSVGLAQILGYIPLFLRNTGVDGDTGEVTLAQKFVELGGTEGTLDEDDDLVELQLVEEIVELAVLLGLTKLDVVLLETVEGELGLVVNVDLQRVTHKLLADGTGLLGESGREHHNLLLCRGSAEDFLHVAAHVCSRVSD
jgi:hypothetical protein